MNVQDLRSAACISCDAVARVESQLSASIAAQVFQELVLELAPVGVATFDSHGNVLSLNKAMLEIWGLVNDPIAKRTFLGKTGRWPSGRKVRSSEWPHQRALAGQVVSGELVEISRFNDGEQRHLLMNAAPLLTADGSFLGAMTIHVDVTIQKKLEKELAEAQERIVRTARLNAMGALSGTIAHELNQPLGACSNYLGAARISLLDKGTCQEADQLLSRASEQIERADDIIHRIRRFAESGEVRLSSESVGNLIEAAWEQLGLVHKGALPAFVLQGELDVVVTGDKMQLEQVLINLLLNACQAMRSTSAPALTVTAAAEGKFVTIRVEDNGPGIPAHIQGSLFDAFTTSRKGGTGLGLALCRTIVEANGGTINLASSSGAGSAFMISLPAGLETRL